MSDIALFGELLLLGGLTKHHPECRDPSRHQFLLSRLLDASYMVLPINFATLSNRQIHLGNYRVFGTIRVNVHENKI